MIEHGDDDKGTMTEQRTMIEQGNNERTVER